MVKEGAESANPALTQENAVKIMKGEDQNKSRPEDTDPNFGVRSTSKTTQTQERDQADYEARKEHSNSGSNTHEGQGMEYVSRKKGSAHDAEDMDISGGGQGGGRLSKR